MLTVDEVIQTHVETAIAKTKKKTSSDKVSAIVMNTKTGDILAMAQTPGFDLNNPRVPLLKSERAKLDKMSETKKGEYWSHLLPTCMSPALPSSFLQRLWLLRREFQM